jgi:hypothetical protein
MKNLLGPMILKTILHNFVILHSACGMLLKLIPYAMTQALCV